MNKAVEENLKPRTIITYGIIFVFLYLCLKQLPIPDLLRDLVMVMQGYWFGSRIAQKPTNEGGQQK